MYIHADSLYPRAFSKPQKAKSKKQNFVLLGIGGNKPKTLRSFFYLFKKLRAHPKIRAIQSSPILHNPAFGYIEQADFENALLALHSSLSLNEIYVLIFYLERVFGRGRVREFKNAPRILDIDIIFYNKVILKRAYLTIPHKNWKERASVCIPMSFLDISKTKGV
ncbi:2-amino-4-hydroxy-6-hydroxymethyldihydropteridine diphosphokinase [Helicobacter sp. MIT 00-7814]|uniref:2-amino-4-hydroxy-6- hydroxymethyldihydropteridine diphosphokinase n=1 Tax=unclassified Helicobacter TaxID=2593540 RepID=UPI000E1FA13D|nr:MULTISPECIES: 2-amino-4-hydroxy-6-hydroxymethyldihydropteridine diphosphokinase [unclassified Helicobacter]RDU55894.1 2-amino-4-hydroxy-6-hydroxymethyldihydropteridine diphosphokinase [Helicobacter sp. MIT 00-7814]RDU56852.1 2-amino-4-hydroxy-6-hydroxymethyldihydropteridine diphosphokinase [Helicobacter sp. MIT 99-10781]